MGTDPLAHIWAKSARARQTSGESLVAHINAVLTTLDRLQELNPNLPERTDQPHVWQWIYWACALHDHGKVAQGFQQQLRDSGYRWQRRHEVLSLGFLPLLRVDPEDPAYQLVAAGIVAHHRDAQSIRELYPLFDDVTNERIQAMVGEVSVGDIEALARWTLSLTSQGRGLGDAVPLKPEQFAAEFHENAVSTITAALTRYQALVRALHAGRERPLLLSALALRGLVMSADHIGSAHEWEELSGPFRADTAKAFRQPRPWSHQLAAENLSGSMMLIAPTGSGKTETAILWAGKQTSERAVSHLFYVLPYQASMNAMASRLEPRLGRISLIHGRALEAVYRQLEDNNSQAEALRKAYAAQNLARLQVRTTRVLSPYQLLKVAFRLRGYESLSADLFDSALIYDEIHAYEPARLALIIGQLGDLVARFGARACVMSATLPTFLRGWLTEAVPGLSTPISSTSQEFATFRRHRLQVLDGDLLTELDRIATDCQQRAVLVCCNTVARAQAAFDGLRTRGCQPVLLHGRFTGRDRLAKEQLLAPAEEQHVVLVATQVVEVSLNVSFATIYSDPAPLEALFQRFGRVNRFRLDGVVAPVHVFTEPVQQLVYSSDLITEAVRILRTHDGEAVDEAQLNSWLDDQYTADILAGIERQYRPVLSLMQDKLRRLAPFQSDPNLREEFFEMFDSVEVLPAALQPEYSNLVDAGHVIEADSLLVSISSSQWARLKRHGLADIDRDEDLRLVSVPYDSDYGLQLT